MLFDFLRDRATIKELRKELGEARRELERLEQHEFRDWKKGFGVVWGDGVTDDTAAIQAAHSVAHFALTEPKIQSREHSDVFKIDSIDSLIAGTRR